MLATVAVSDAGLILINADTIPGGVLEKFGTNVLSVSLHAFPPQTVILIILSFMYHCVRLCKKVLWGIPGLVMYVLMY